MLALALCRAKWLFKAFCLSYPIPFAKIDPNFMGDDSADSHMSFAFVVTAVVKVAEDHGVITF